VLQIKLNDSMAKTTDNGQRTTDKIMSDQILVTEENGIATITLNRPEKMNAFFGHMRRDFAEILERVGGDDDVRVVIITGAGRGFCAGADIDYLIELVERRDANEFARLLGSARRVLTTIRQMNKPVVASINGAAAGAGCNVALACDIRIASSNAIFSQAFAKIGLHPDWGGTYFLPRIVPANIACEMFFLGDSIDAEKAYQLGLINRVVAPEELENETKNLAQRLAAAPPISVAAAKRAVYMSDQETLEAMLQYELEAQLECFHSEDLREGLRAFKEKRKPKFTGR
jgi:2-(1,2-epoxy-1,2-dihydrophenyl)acetyl-CoA isomerase